MRIEWNKVTWYSKLAAVILFLIVFWTGFYFGQEYQKIAAERSTNTTPVTNNRPK